ncbi:hypothetical protein [Nostoc linckia]|nr:hypothetical protein [Nostoc linckia]
MGRWGDGEMGSRGAGESCCTIFFSSAHLPLCPWSLLCPMPNAPFPK